MTPAPLLDADCLAKILRGEKLQLIDIGPFLVLLGGDARKWPIMKNSTFGPTEVKDAFDVAGLDFAKLEEFKVRYCGDPLHRALN